MYLADLPELAHVGNLSESKFPISAYLIPADELDDTNGVFPWRTEKNMREIQPLTSHGIRVLACATL